MDLSDYFLIEEAARDRLGDLRRARQGKEPEEAPMSTLARMLHIASALQARPRAIDRYIDYFGDRVPAGDEGTDERVIFTSRQVRGLRRREG